LIFETTQKWVDEAKNIIQTLMQETVKLTVPLEVNIGVGLNWEEAH